MGDLKTEAAEAAEQLLGTPNLLIEIPIGRKNADNLDFLIELENHVICCDCCGWWVEADEAVQVESEFQCLDCAEGC